MKNGTDEKNKPNEHCVWQEYLLNGLFGWVETDEHLRKHIQNKIKE